MKYIYIYNIKTNILTSYTSFIEIIEKSCQNKIFRNNLIANMLPQFKVITPMIIIVHIFDRLGINVFFQQTQIALYEQKLCD